MQFTLIDFFIGFFLMNAMPHLIFAQTDTRFLSLFGFTPMGNHVYAFFNTTVALLLFQIEYGLQSVFTNGLFVGAGAIMFIYFLTGRFFYRLFQAQTS